MSFSVKRTVKRIRQLLLKYKVALVAILVAIVALVVILTCYSVAPSTFPRNAIVRINKHMTVSAAASLFKEKGIIKSAYLFKIYVVLLRDGKGVQAGSYLFDEPQSALRVAYRASYGIKNVEKIKLTIFEGTNTKEIASLVKKSIPDFNTTAFLEEAKPLEGYLFPETYFVDPDVTPHELISMMRDQFDVAIKPLEDAIATSTHSLKDILTMASIVEKEARKYTDRQTIAGILWKRIDKGMALQVDVPFYYIFNNKTGSITLKDLATTSPYNTYLNKGLPPTPITNPGLNAIRATLYPITTPYYFYLADGDGVTHYATTHDGHIINRQKYLQ